MKNILKQLEFPFEELEEKMPTYSGVRSLFRDDNLRTNDPAIGNNTFAFVTFGKSKVSPAGEAIRNNKK